MTMFAELYALATDATLTMVVSADERSGTMTISVLPKPKKETVELALTKDLTLTATPDEFDAGFINALRGYRETRASLTEQAEATREALEAAKALTAKKATDAVAKFKPGQRALAPASKEIAVDEDAGGEQNDENARSAAAPVNHCNCSANTWRVERAAAPLQHYSAVRICCLNLGFRLNLWTI